MFDKVHTVLSHMFTAQNLADLFPKALIVKRLKTQTTAIDTKTINDASW